MVVGLGALRMWDFLGENSQIFPWYGYFIREKFELVPSFLLYIHRDQSSRTSHHAPTSLHLALTVFFTRFDLIETAWIRILAAPIVPSHGRSSQCVQEEATCRQLDFVRRLRTPAHLIPHCLGLLRTSGWLRDRLEHCLFLLSPST